MTGGKSVGDVGQGERMEGLQKTYGRQPDIVVSSRRKQDPKERLKTAG